MQRNGSRAGFENAAKDRQSRFRDASLTIGDRARSPADGTGNHHLLALGSREENLLEKPSFFFGIVQLARTAPGSDPLGKIPALAGSAQPGVPSLP